MSSVSVPALGGTAEVADELGCRKQQVHALRQRDDFPAPVLVLAATPVWDLTEIREFRDSWKRRKESLDTLTA